MLKNHLKTKHLILASGSPRRQELLEQLNIPFEIRLKPVDENYPDHLEAHQITDYLSQIKANVFKGKLKTNDILITSDTIVWHNNKALGKPNSNQEAKIMLSALSGQSHEVITSVCLTSSEKQITAHSKTTVYFRTLTEKEIEYYLNNYSPLDKAGAYGIQDWIGQIGIYKIEGSYYNVMGFPMDIIYDLLLEF